MSVAGIATDNLGGKLTTVLGRDLNGRDLIDNVIVGQNIAFLRVDDNAGAGRIDLLLELFRNVEELTEQRIAIKRVVLTDSCRGRRY